MALTWQTVRSPDENDRRQKHVCIKGNLNIFIRETKMIKTRLAM